jgi:hypothetical protein
MKSQDDLEKALVLNGLKFGEREIRVQLPDASEVRIWLACFLGTRKNTRMGLGLGFELDLGLGVRVMVRVKVRVGVRVRVRVRFRDIRKA